MQNRQHKLNRRRKFCASLCYRSAFPAQAALLADYVFSKLRVFNIRRRPIPTRASNLFNQLPQDRQRFTTSFLNSAETSLLTIAIVYKSATQCRVVPEVDPHDR